MKKLLLILLCLHLVFSSCNPIFTFSNPNPIYKCGICKMEFQDEVWAKKCEAWCLGNNSCNFEITKHSITVE